MIKFVFVIIPIIISSLGGWYVSIWLCNIIGITDVVYAYQQNPTNRILIGIGVCIIMYSYIVGVSFYFIGLLITKIIVK